MDEKIAIKSEEDEKKEYREKNLKLVLWFKKI